MLFIWLGALLVIGGALYMVRQAIWQGPLSALGRRRAILWSPARAATASSGSQETGPASH